MHVEYTRDPVLLATQWRIYLQQNYIEIDSESIIDSETVSIIDSEKCSRFPPLVGSTSWLDERSITGVYIDIHPSTTQFMGVPYRHVVGVQQVYKKNHIAH